MPMPRLEEIEDRLALSKLALKMKGRPTASQTALQCFPTASPSSRDSSVHGPAIIASGWFWPTLIESTVQKRLESVFMSKIRRVRGLLVRNEGSKAYENE